MKAARRRRGAITTHGRLQTPEFVVYLEGHLLGIHVLRGKILDVFVEVAPPCTGDRGAHDRRTAGFVVAETLVRSHELTELLQALRNAKTFTVTFAIHKRTTWQP